ncbi:hypothetical protein BB561_003720 [Smittium simulii]|uniref:Endonuclease/exonuclease/phosphatase domain-containing protein n=1 Tax=Smittium simulii TaxID=133385 RepID=A0A2T9YJV5_9FUNG|nr:hypothetical protein BB561_003720 [Smittium simulii]
MSQSAAAELPFSSTKRIVLEHSTVKNTEMQNEIATEAKAIKDSTKPTKLQSLVLNNKNEELISKENIDWFTEFNSIKRPEKINLELSDQPIYADSSCPSTPNFKKEWDKSNENYTENNDSVAVIDMDLVNKLADNNGINDAEIQHEIHYDTELEITLSEAFKMLEKKYGAYIREDSLKKNRKNTTKITQPKKIAFKNNTKLKLITYNIQSIYNKVEELELILSKSAPTVLCLQETHLSEKLNFLKLKGYTCVESKKKLTKIGSGLLIALKNRSGWSVSELWSEYTWMSCKIKSKSTAGQNNELITININMPHITA